MAETRSAVGTTEEKDRPVAAAAPEPAPKPEPITKVDPADDLPQEEDARRSRPKPEDYLRHEEAMLEALLEGAEEAENDTVVIQINRKKGKTFFFRVRSVTEAETEKWRKLATEYRRNRRMGGLKMAEETDVSMYRSLLVVGATTAFCLPIEFDEESGEPITFKDVESRWNNSELRKKLGVEAKWEMVDKLLKAGEKDNVVARVEALSGFDEEAEEHLKN